MSNKEDFNSLFIYIHDVIINAGQLLFNSFNKKRTVRNKGVIDLVTDADISCENYIISKIKEKYPDHSILSEEEGSICNSKDHLWILDPLDGTTNYSRKLPIFCISLAFSYKNKVKFGIIYSPTLNYFFYAKENQGAYLNNKKITVSKTSDLMSSFLVTGFPYDIRTTKNDNIDIFTAFLKNSLAIRRLGSAALDLCFVAAGIFDCYWELNLKLWDFAAGGLILEEAGGKLTDINGKKINVSKNLSSSIVGSNSIIHDNIIKIIQENNKE
jgi:myo-inositol-1(or 4)-monophosphatase